MTTFQLLFLGFLGLLVTGIFAGAARGKLSRREAFLWSGLCFAAAVAIVWPHLTSALAKGLGIGRGADLLLYLAVGVMMAGFWTTYMNLRALRREVTLLVRHIALLEAQEEPAEDTTADE